MSFFKKTTKAAKRSKSFGIVASAICLMALLFALAACSAQEKPNDTASSANAEQQTSEDGGNAPDATGMGYSNFLEGDPGNLPENFYTDDWINDGSRGCNACHENLWDTISDLRPLAHLASSSPGYGRDATWLDCYRCHGGRPLAGGTVTDSIHAMHMGNEMFVDQLNGNCFSCHALNTKGDYIMYDFYRLSSSFGGFPNAGSDAMINWSKLREWGTDTIAGITVQHDMPITVTDLNQDATDKEDRFTATNNAIPEVDAATWTLKVTGVVNEREFSLEDLRAMPQTETTLMHACLANANASYQVANIPFKGVLLKDIIEACGGLKEGNVTVVATGADGWSFPGGGAGMDVQTMIDLGALVILEEWGEPLSTQNGYPAVWGMPGLPAGPWSKWLATLEFTSDPGMTDLWSSLCKVTFPTGHNESTNVDLADPWVSFDTKSSAPLSVFWTNPVNNDEVLTMQDGKIRLSGFAYLWGHDGHQIERIAFSADYGTTWTYVDIPADTDPHRMIEFAVDWTPEAAGNYVLYACAIDAKAGWQAVPSAIAVTVE